MMDESQGNVPSTFRAVKPLMPGRKLALLTSPLYSPPLVERLLLLFSLSVASGKKRPWEKSAGKISLWIIDYPGAMLLLSAGPLLLHVWKCSQSHAHALVILA